MKKVRFGVGKVRPVAEKYVLPLKSTLCREKVVTLRKSTLLRGKVCSAMESTFSLRNYIIFSCGKVCSAVEKNVFVHGKVRPVAEKYVLGGQLSFGVEKYVLLHGKVM